MVRKIKFEVSGKQFYTLLAVVALIIVATGVYAYNSGYGDPSIFGHSADELSGVCLSDGTNCPAGVGGSLWVEGPGAYITYDSEGVRAAGYWPKLYTGELQSQVLLYGNDSNNLPGIEIKSTQDNIGGHIDFTDADIPGGGSDYDVRLFQSSDTALTIDSLNGESEFNVGSLNAKSLDLNNGTNDVSLCLGTDCRGSWGVNNVETIYSASSFTGSSEAKSLETYCPDGKIASGGGYAFSDGQSNPLPIYVTRNAATTDQKGWAAKFYYTGSETYYASVYAICVPGAPMGGQEAISSGTASLSVNVGDNGQVIYPDGRCGPDEQCDSFVSVSGSTTYNFNAQPENGYELYSWGGECAGVETLSCGVTIEEGKSHYVSVSFVPTGSTTPDDPKNPGGPGTVL